MGEYKVGHRERDHETESTWSPVQDREEPPG